MIFPFSIPKSWIICEANLWMIGVARPDSYDLSSGKRLHNELEIHHV